VRMFGDITLAEDAVQDAFVVASEKWQESGIPPNPAGWIVTTARNRAIDKLRRSAKGRDLDTQLGTNQGRLLDEDAGVAGDDGPVSDDRLRLIFTCCHPALREEHQVALTLRLLGGLSVNEVAGAFLVTEPAMAKRLVRAKYKIKAARIPYRLPGAGDLPIRLRSVLSVMYLIYNAGANDPARVSLRTEAIRLARGLAELMPDEPEAAGLLALMLLNESRMDARMADGEIVLLSEQDRGMWNQALIDEGHTIVRACIRRSQPGPFQVQAAIQAVHCDADSFESTDWSQIVILYNDLYSMTPTPVIALNRAVAIAETDGPASAVAALDAMGPDLNDYYLMHSTKATMLRRLGEHSAARGEFQYARELATRESDRRFLSHQIDGLG
jgi:RNA polymerase sigma-70 factor (ECF subfamily)